LRTWLRRTWLRELVSVSASARAFSDPALPLDHQFNRQRLTAKSAWGGAQKRTMKVDCVTLDFTMTCGLTTVTMCTGAGYGSPPCPNAPPPRQWCDARSQVNPVETPICLMPVTHLGETLLRQTAALGRCPAFSAVPARKGGQQGQGALDPDLPKRPQRRGSSHLPAVAAHRGCFLGPFRAD
jgi:hypothetical protein